jgi:hypothetical protein
MSKGMASMAIQAKTYLSNRHTPQATYWLLSLLVASLALIGFGQHAHSIPKPPPAYFPSNAADNAYSSLPQTANAFIYDTSKDMQRKSGATPDLRSSALKLQKAKAAVDRRQKQLDKARLNYLRIRGRSTQEPLPDAYAKLAANRVETASEALQQAKEELDQAHMAFSIAKAREMQNQLAAQNAK